MDASMSQKRFKLIACSVLTREVCHCIARCVHTIDPVFPAKAEHVDADRLRGLLQSHIDAADAEALPYDAVLLAYGLCGNSAVGLAAGECPLVIPRAHDCTTLLLGSKEAFKEEFGDNPSQGWASVGYSERGDDLIADPASRQHLAGASDFADLVAQYGEENAKYLIEAMGGHGESDTIYFLDVPETRNEVMLERIRAQAARDGLKVKTLPGSLRLIDALLSGEWSEEDFLVVPQGHRIVGEYDWERVVSAQPGCTSGG